MDSNQGGYDNDGLCEVEKGTVEPVHHKERSRRSVEDARPTLRAEDRRLCCSEETRTRATEATSGRGHQAQGRIMKR